MKWPTPKATGILQKTSTLPWILEHQGEENELADQLASQGSATSFLGPESFFGITKSQKSSFLLFQRAEQTESDLCYYCKKAPKSAEYYTLSLRGTVLQKTHGAFKTRTVFKNELIF